MQQGRISFRHASQAKLETRIESEFETYIHFTYIYNSVDWNTFLSCKPVFILLATILQTYQWNKK
jgi:hypothetical protein